MYWNVGKFLSDESKGKEYGDLYIDSVANFIQGEFSGIKGFNRCGLYRMKQFYETYCDNEIVSPLVTQLSWTNNLLILSSTKTMEEKEFYIRLAIKENLGKFKPEYVSKMDFYLEALNRQNKKQHENPSVGVILCAQKNDEIVEYAMSRTMSPMLVSKYMMELPDKKMLQNKLQEFALLLEDKQTYEE